MSIHNVILHPHYWIMVMIIKNCSNKKFMLAYDVALTPLHVHSILGFSLFASNVAKRAAALYSHTSVIVIVAA